MYNILYVQNNEEIARHFMDEFLSSDYRLLVAHTGEEALSVIQETEVLLLLIDINIPDMRIRRLIRHAREINPGIIVNVCIDVCDYKLITKLVNRYGVHKIYVAPWNMEEIIYEIGDSIEVALINEDANIAENTLLVERESLDKTIVNLRSALEKQRLSHEKIKKITDCFMDGVAVSSASTASGKAQEFMREVFDRYLLLMTTGKFSIDDLEEYIKNDFEEISKINPGFAYVNVISCFFGGVRRSDAINCRFAVWLLAKFYSEFYKQVTMDIRTHFTTTTEARFSCYISAHDSSNDVSCIEAENILKGFILSVLNVIVRGVNEELKEDINIFEFNVNVRDD